jgi:hypothetical protein
MHVQRSWVTPSILILLGTVYCGLLHFQRTLTGTNMADGIIGVVLGLYICSHPAARLVDLLFYRRSIQRSFSSKGSALLWLALNGLVLLTGWLSIFIGTVRMVGKGE